MSIDSATLLEEEEVEVPVTKEQTKEPAKMKTDEASSDAAPPSTNEIDVNMQDAKDTGDAPGAENGVPESRDKLVQMETDANVNCLLSVILICGFSMNYLFFFLGLQLGGTWGRGRRAIT